MTWGIMEMPTPAIVSFSKMPGKILQYVRVPPNTLRRSLEVVMIFIRLLAFRLLLIFIRL